MENLLGSGKLNEEGSSGGADSHSESGSAPTLRVLIVDDDEVVLSVTTEVIRALGYEPDEARDGAEALAKINETEYDAILCDLRMPVMDGEILFRVLQERKPHIAKRVIFSTGDTGAQSSHQILKRLGAPFIAKPFNMDELDALIKSVAPARKQSESES